MADLINSTDFEKILMDNELVLVDFFATWCPPCKMLAPILEQISNERNDILVLKVNIDEFKSIGDKYDVHAVPTLVFFKNNEEVKRHIGFTGKDQLEQIIEELK